MTTLYYSSRCNLCKKFVQLLHDMDLLDMIPKKISKETSIFPEKIRFVPTIVNEEDILEGNEVFNIIEFLQYTKQLKLKQAKEKSQTKQETLNSMCSLDDNFCELGDLGGENTRLQDMASNFQVKTVEERMKEYQAMAPTTF